MSVDLQMHSTFSDGSFTPTKLVEMAAENGVKLMSLTDHDGTQGIDEAMKAGVKYGVQVISGIELTTAVNEKTIHILGYNFDEKDFGIQKVCNQMRESRKRVFLGKLQGVNEQLKKEGRKQIDLDSYVEKQQGFFGLGKALEFMIQTGVMTSKEEGIKYWNEAPEVPKNAITPEEAIGIIHSAGGIAVLSHPLAPKLSLKSLTADKKEQEKIISEFTDFGLDGIECYTPCHEQDDIELALVFAGTYNLLVTVGSDWHGPIETIGEQVRSYIPHYVEKVGDVEVPDEVTDKLFAYFS